MHQAGGHHFNVMGIHCLNIDMSYDDPTDMVFISFSWIEYSSLSSAQRSYNTLWCVILIRCGRRLIENKQGHSIEP